ncbi:HNH endonuclease [Candidatus Woesebacteria bacterium]|nr:HNH endonuclease [Candidatus Woesebacteria bacterium]MCD8506944.1 HNH endonuclease [Candidatus Woesebacteria bacterium]MCD8527234.1 HNH endonuclease [Candidatus Woesebacteria bacterium]MCD8546600.1 HNH endonuclease [Candidatus Woesebacteria bacterium]
MGVRRGNFSAETRDRVRIEANWCCQKCGKKTKELEVHHLLPKSVARTQYPHIPEYMVASPHNAAALCSDCHKEENKLSFREHAYFATLLLSHFAENHSRNEHQSLELR